MNDTTPALPENLPAVFVTAISGGALVAALIAQYGLGLRPCQLCLIERIPFVIAMVLGILGMQQSVGAARRRLLVVAAGAVLLVNSGIGVYHVGVEQHWWASSCSGGSGPGGLPAKADDLAAMMSKAADEPACDQPEWHFQGITIASLNVIYSGAMGILAIGMATSKPPSRPQPAAPAPEPPAAKPRSDKRRPSPRLKSRR